MTETATPYAVAQLAQNPMVPLIERLLEQPDFNIEALKELRQMQKEAQAEAAEGAFLTDFARLQGDLPSITRAGKSNNNTYATYDDIMDAVRPIMAVYGFSFSCIPNSTEQGLEVFATLAHTQGHKLTSSIHLPLDTTGSKSAVQSVGSTMKYGQRYCVCALLSISTHDQGYEGGDNDGVVRVYVDDDKASTLEAAASSYGVTKGRIFGYYSKKLGTNINRWDALPDDLFDEVMAQIVTMAKKKK